MNFHITESDFNDAAQTEFGFAVTHPTLAGNKLRGGDLRTNSAPIRPKIGRALKSSPFYACLSDRVGCKKSLGLTVSGFVSYTFGQESSAQVESDRNARQ